MISVDAVGRPHSAMGIADGILIWTGLRNLVPT